MIGCVDAVAGGSGTLHAIDVQNPVPERDEEAPRDVETQQSLKLPREARCALDVEAAEVRDVSTTLRHLVSEFTE